MTSNTLLSEATGATTPPLLDETIGANLARTTAQFPENEALVVVHQGIRWTYTEIWERVDELARAFLAAGFDKGDRIGVWAPNVAEWTLTQYATARIGVIQVNLNPAYRTHEVEYALNQSGCRGLVAAAQFKTSDYEGMISELRDRLPHLEHSYFIDTPSWAALLAGAAGRTSADVEAVAVTLRPDDPINIQYTSGTTGFPKGATLTHKGILNNAHMVAEACKFTDEDRVNIPVPLYHCFGMVMGNLGCTTRGATMVYPAASFEAPATLQAVADEACTSLYGVPTMFIAELADDSFGSYDLSTLRTGIMAGSPCPVEIMKQTMVDMHMDQVTIAYGMTETSPVSTQTATDDPIEKRVATVGRVQPHLEAKIIDPATGSVVPRGEAGEYCARGYSIMDGYWNDPDKTREAIDTEGWMHSGDLAVMDDDGYINIVGRIKDMVIRGGENIYPREIEEFLYTHPAIADVQVIGVPDATYGEEIFAWVQLVDGATLDAEEVRSFCRGSIAHFKVPRYVHVTEEFPMTVTGKIQKFKLRDTAIELLGIASEGSPEAS